ncbi:UDP-N-acetylmuramoyl-L-alanine--D-glutamate ligase [Lutibaculum baratangense]|uniref:UDP-N-acetylmuramoylalanine--D-glutamate ligase n=1 Tax=Lutibaculum baratangense AMV1 TaxID=631454 RepID=V4TNR5_9HYPH|nr:UDP-N-acetylmuramoyl-L-alanine--D-glutamate ligase [Lutibaculum baratangense]ESR27333.1 UDP-N-acetylmuramoylalanine--D-glutamate ligase [Lutibaculum baratangense AMV1]
MIPVTCLEGHKVAIFGLARTGLEAARALIAGGAEVVLWDDSAPRAEEARRQGFPVDDLRGLDFGGLSALVLSPGVPLTHPAPHWTVERALAAGIEIIGDTELFFRERAHRAPGAAVVAITGTNGKSTTTALIGHLLRQAGRRVGVGGNIGTACLSLDDLSPDITYVLEMSSYQIDLTPTLNPSVGILLNVTPDHIDRHGTFENYAAVKARMVMEADRAVLAVDDDVTRVVAAQARESGRAVTEVSCLGSLDAGLFADGTRLVWRDGEGDGAVADLASVPALRGQHNAQNAAAAVAAVVALGVPMEEATRGLTSFPGLAHRMEEVARHGRIVFVNDSKATNADAASRSLSSFEHIHWIAGGRAKSGGIDSLEALFPRVARAYLIGEAAEAFAQTLAHANVPHEIAGDMEAAVRAAAENAEKDAAPGVVLLAPACASFDQFADFEARGDAFRRCVGALDGVALKPREAV